MATATLQNRTVLVTGAGGQLGRHLRPALEAAGARVVGLGARPGRGIDLVADVTDAAAIKASVAAARPDAIVHAAAYTDVDGCERDPVRAAAVNATGAAHVAAAARGAGAYLVAIGTDYVFPGDGGAPYEEDAATRPLSEYGRSKLAGERAVLATDPGFAVARTSWLYGGPGKHFPRMVLSVLRDRGEMAVVTDERGSPTFAGDLAAGLVALVALHGRGLFHLANEGGASRFELARAVAAAAGLEPTRVRPTTRAAFAAGQPPRAPRPIDSSLRNVRAAALGIRLRPWEEAIARYAPRLASELAAERSAAP